MQHCVEIAEDFNQARDSGAIYIFRPGFESAKKLAETEQESGIDEFTLQDTSENLYNRVSILGVDMSDAVISDVKEFLLLMVNTEPKSKSGIRKQDFLLSLCLCMQ
jgi:hypothetical protein